MASTSETRYRNLNGNQVLVYLKNRNSVSNKKNGRINRSIQSPFNVLISTARAVYSHGLNPATGKGQPPVGARFNPFTHIPSSHWNSLEQIALAKFRGKIRKGNASLGITLATLGQSRDMVNHRIFAMQDSIARAGSYLSTKRGRSRLKRRIKDVAKRRGELTAGHVLEGFFGWAPLIGDMRAVMNTLFQQGIPPQVVKGIHRGVMSSSTGTPSSEDYRTHSALTSVTIAATVGISNPNVWLASRSGVLNPGTVAWDLIPWSWVVNMFVNVNSLLSASTDYAGLTFSRQSVTKTGRLLSTQVARGYGGTSCGCQVFTYAKSRVVGSIPSATLMFRVPELDVSLGLIASALLVQKARKINDLIHLLSK